MLTLALAEPTQAGGGCFYHASSSKNTARQVAFATRPHTANPDLHVVCNLNVGNIVGAKFITTLASQF